MLVAVGNAPSYGGGMQVCPDADLDDGLLDVTVLGPISKPEFLRVFPTVYKGTHVSHPAVTVRRARSVLLQAERRDGLRRRRARLGAAGDVRGGGRGVARLHLTGGPTPGT